jgi:Arc/MetJ family transcription regulator
MRTTLNLPDEIMIDLMRATGEKNKTKLIRGALEEALRRVKRKRLLEMQGKVEFDIDLEILREADRMK